MEAGHGQGQQSTEEACVPSWGSRSVWESNSITVVENKFFEDLSEYLCQTAIPVLITRVEMIFVVLCEQLSQKNFLPPL